MDKQIIENVEDAITQARKEYYREWRKNNPERVKQHTEKFWKKRAEKILAELSTK